MKKDDFDAVIHYFIAFIGGFLGLFPILNIAFVFGSAQTANMIEIVVLALSGSPKTFLLHFLGAIIYLIPIFSVTLLKRRTNLDVRLMALAADAMTAALIPFLPEKMPATVAMYPTFFAMSFQWSSFSGAYGFTSSTIFSTNNLKQCFSALTEIVFNKDKGFCLKAKFFGLTLISFHIGVASCFILWKQIGNYSFLFALLPIIAATFFVVRFSPLKKK